MSQQINLYEARLRPRVLLLTGQRLLLALVLVLVLGSSLAFVTRRQADQAAAEMGRVQSEVKNWQEKHDALSKQVTERRISPALQNELDRVKTMLSVRVEVVSLLDAGKLGNTQGFSSLFYGFSRHTTSNSWLTSFSVGAGGQEIEIRGKLLDAGKLPAYVQRLSQDPAFQGRRLAALSMKHVEPADAKQEPIPLPKGSEKPEPRLPRHVEFTLRTEHGGDTAKLAEGAK